MVFAGGTLQSVPIPCPLPRGYGGTIEVSLPPSTKLVTATWKHTAYFRQLHRPKRAGEVPEISIFQQESGAVLIVSGEGKVIFFRQFDCGLCDRS